MKKNLGSKTWLYPMPVLIIATYNDDKTPNAMNAAWGGIAEENKISICIDDSHKTYENLVVNQAFTVGVADTENVVSCDYVGIVSGKKEKDKFKKSGFTATPSEFVQAPIIDQLKMTLECKVIKIDECCVLGEIVNVCVDEDILTDGKIDLNKFTPITYDPVNHDYVALGQKVGKAFCDGYKLK